MTEITTTYSILFAAATPALGHVDMGANVPALAARCAH